jgi:hypothetical protein
MGFECSEATPITVWRGFVCHGEGLSLYGRVHVHDRSISLELLD